MRAAVVTHDGELIDRRAEPTPRDAACPDALMELAGGMLADPPDLPTSIEVVTAELGDDAGLVGAAGWRRARNAPCHG